MSAAPLVGSGLGGNSAMRVRESEVLVVGSGAAGLTCALALAPRPVLLLTAAEGLVSGSTELAQGGVAAALAPGDTPAAHAADTLAAGAGLVDAGMAELLTREGAESLRRLIAEGLPVDRGADGAPAFGREGAHGLARILHAEGDATGRVLAGWLAERALAAPSVEIATRALAVDLVVEQGRLRGLIAFHAEAGWVFHRCRHLVLATGGLGAAWRQTTNAAGATGGGLAMAARAGVALRDLEFVQFHPTALAVGGEGPGERLPLLSEALRGAGARLLDGAGDAFMAAEHPAGDLAPRDVVSRAIWRRLEAGERVTLDLRPALAGRGPGAFPQAIAACRAAGFDPLREPVPVVPAAHYHMGGIATDAEGRSSLPGLWACGEAACTGVHGANRLASNSLLEALVFGRRVAAAIGEAVEEGQDSALLPLPAVPVLPALPGPALAALAQEVRDLLWREVGLSRSDAGLGRALARLGELDAALRPAGGQYVDAPALVRQWARARDLVLVGRLVALAARRRRESRGGHFRADYPHSAEAWRRRQTLSLCDLETAAGFAPPASAPVVPAQMGVSR